MQITQRISPCLWFDSQAEEAAAFYVSVFKNSKITSVTRYPKAGEETPKAQQCGWLKDKYGLSWQVVPAILLELLKDHESPTAQRAMEALLRMKKIDISELERAVAREHVTT
jgi:predicted 3-demethylubiquinone-9 3-methyltransferase (glyoxalase superfamily)